MNAVSFPTAISPEDLETLIQDAYVNLVNCPPDRRREFCDEFMALIRMRDPETVMRMEGERMDRVGLR
jgi:hypothetical protein